jgi:iron(III) transport system permease protein
MTFSKPSVFTVGRTLTGTVALMLIGYIIIRTPYTLRMIKSAYASIDGALEEAAKNLGASTIRTYFKVLLPVLLPTILSVFLLNFIGLLAEYNVSVFLFHPMYQPLGVVLNAATRADASPDAQMLSFVYSVLIMIVSTMTIIFVNGGKKR